MQIQKQISRKIGEKEYEKFFIVVSPKIIKELKWKKGDVLDPKIENGKLIIENDRNKRT